MRLLLAVLLVALTLGCSTESREFAPWTMVPGASVPVHEYGPPDRRPNPDHRIRFEEDLVISASEDPAASFFRVGTVGVDDNGFIYVVDSGNKRVQVFDTEGGFVRSLGVEGQGPGELMLPTALAIAGGQVIVNDFMNRRLGVWDTLGLHVGDFRPAGGRLMTERMPSLDSGFVAVHRVTAESGSTYVVAAFDAEGNETARFAESPFVEPLILGGQVGFGMFSPTPSAATDSRDRVYVAGGTEYQVHAFDAAGQPQWALRVAEPRAPLTAQIRDQAMTLVRKRFEDLEAPDTEWPALLPAIERVAVDGTGRVYVYPFHADAGAYGTAGLMNPETSHRPVDVYSANGELLWSGSIPLWEWTAARGEFVYGVGRDDDDEQTIVRYRIVFP